MTDTTTHTTETLEASPAFQKLKDINNQRFVLHYRESPYISRRSAELKAESVDLAHFFTKEVPVEMEEIDRMFSRTEDGRSVLRDKYKALVTAHFEIMESMKAEKIIRARATQVTVKNGVPGLGFLHGGIEVFVPWFEFIEDETLDLEAWRKGSRHLSESDVQERIRILASRLNSQIKVIIGAYNAKGRYAFGSRIRAMNKERYVAFVKENERQMSIGGNLVTRPNVVVGDIIRANVLNVIRSAVYCEFMGAEFTVTSAELNNGFINDAQDFYAPGQLIDLRVTEITKGKTLNDIDCQVEIKAVGVEERDNFEFYMGLIPVGTKLTGTVTQIDGGNFFVRVQMDNFNYSQDIDRHKSRVRSYVDVLCKNPSFGIIPEVGFQVTIAVTGYNTEARGLFGVLNRTHPKY